MTAAVVWIKPTRNGRPRHAIEYEAWARHDVYVQTVCGCSMRRPEQVPQPDSWPYTAGGNCRKCVERLLARGPA